MTVVHVAPPAPRVAESGHGVSVTTMGCKVNAFESALIREQLNWLGFSNVNGSRAPNIAILNTCTVTAEADRQARQQVRRIIQKNPDAWVVVTGCYAQMNPQACAEIPGVDLVVGNAGKQDIPKLLKPLMRGELPPVLVGDMGVDIGLPGQLVSGFEGKTRAFVQVQQGCDRGCTFCVIHKARGPSRSFSAAMIKRQIERLVLNGYHEVVLCGVDIGSYGDDLPTDFGLEVLIEQILELPHAFRIRLSSIDPAHVSNRLIDLMAQNRHRICPHLHLSLQSGNTLILKRMKRRATREVLLERVSTLKQALPDVVLSADILVGFPTEEEAQFLDTMEVVNRLDIAFPHVFTYSMRPGTPAARIPRQVVIAERKSRARRLRELGDRVRQRVAISLIGCTLPVLLEQRGTGENEDVIGRADNYFGVRLPKSLPHWDDWQNIDIVGFDGEMLVAQNAG